MTIEQGYILVGNTKIPLYNDTDLVITRIQVLIKGVWECDFITPEDPLIDEIGSWLVSH